MGLLVPLINQSPASPTVYVFGITDMLVYMQPNIFHEVASLTDTSAFIQPYHLHAWGY